MERLSATKFVCGCGRDVPISSTEIDAWRANGAAELWQIVDVMKSVRARIAEHAPCSRDARWAIAITARVLALDEAFVRTRYEDYLEWLEGR